MRQHFPGVQIRVSFRQVRSWGSEASLHITKPFNAPHELGAICGPHEEIVAVTKGTPELEKFIEKSIKQGDYTVEELDIRLEKTRQLLTQNYKELFSEVSIREDGTLFIHDGYHRAGLSVHNGLDYFHAVVSIPIDLR